MLGPFSVHLLGPFSVSEVTCWQTPQVNYAKLVSDAKQAAKPAAAVGAHPALDGRLGGEENDQVKRVSGQEHTC